jgi:hypothetical protein
VALGKVCLDLLLVQVLLLLSAIGHGGGRRLASRCRAEIGILFVCLFDVCLSGILLTSASILCQSRKSTFRYIRTPRGQSYDSQIYNSNTSFVMR